MKINVVKNILENARADRRQVKIFMCDGRMISFYLDIEEIQYDWSMYDDRILVRGCKCSRVEDFIIDCDYITHIRLLKTY